MSNNCNGILLPDWVDYIPKKKQRQRVLSASVDLVLPRPDLKRKDKHLNTAWKKSEKEQQYP